MLGAQFEGPWALSEPYTCVSPFDVLLALAWKKYFFFLIQHLTTLEPAAFLSLKATLSTTYSEL